MRSQQIFIGLVLAIGLVGAAQGQEHGCQTNQIGDRSNVPLQVTRLGNSTPVTGFPLEFRHAQSAIAVGRL
jgi:hypothetical protein